MVFWARVSIKLKHGNGVRLPILRSRARRGQSGRRKQTERHFYKANDIIAFISAGWWPNNPGSVLIIPSHHYRDIYDIPATVFAAVNEFGRNLALVMKREYECEGISFRQHNGATGGQSVEHYHLWGFPPLPRRSTLRAIFSGIHRTCGDSKSICTATQEALRRSRNAVKPARRPVRILE
jgi:diadenosine tetraphosphate (Ap4A) HIT family hydrolase